VDYRFFPRDPVPLPDREPERRRLELPRVPFLGPVPDAPGRFADLRAPVEPLPDVCPFFARGASGFEPRPFDLARELREVPSTSPATSPVLSEVVLVRLRDGVPRARPPRPPPPPPMVSSDASRRGAALGLVFADSRFFLRAMCRCLAPAYGKARSTLSVTPAFRRA
jgi:hypothetical protein